MWLTLTRKLFMEKEMIHSDNHMVAQKVYKTAKKVLGKRTDLEEAEKDLRALDLALEYMRVIKKARQRQGDSQETKAKQKEEKTWEKLWEKKYRFCRRTLKLNAKKAVEWADRFVLNLRRNG